MKPRSLTVPFDTVATVESPEHIAFEFQLAGPARRGAAYLLDLIVRGLIVGIVVMLVALAGVAGFDVGGVSRGLVFVALFVLEWGYYVVSELVFNGSSVGKRALGIRVVTVSGHPLDFQRSVLRNLLRGADFLPSAYIIGALVMVRNSRFQRLGDFVAGTMVVVESLRQVEHGLVIDPPPTAEELRLLPERLVLPHAEIEALELYLRRLPRLGIGRQLELAELAAPVLAQRHNLSYRDPQRFLQLLYHQATRPVGRRGGR